MGLKKLCSRPESKVRMVVYGCQFLIMMTGLTEDKMHLDSGKLWIDDAPRWRVTNDSVMGGKSSSRTSRDGKLLLRFEGQVSLENNGGFASVSDNGLKGLSADAVGLRLKVRGDGKTYKMTLRMKGGTSWISHQHRFRTEKNQWTEVELYFRDFIPSYRGNRVADAPPIDPVKVMRVGFLISDKQEGSFQLDVQEIRSF